MNAMQACKEHGSTEVLTPATSSPFPPHAWDVIDYDALKEGRVDLPEAVSIVVSRWRMWFMLFNITVFLGLMISSTIIWVVAPDILPHRAIDFVIAPSIILLFAYWGGIPIARIFFAKKPLMVMSRAGVSFPCLGVPQISWEHVRLHEQLAADTIFVRIDKAQFSRWRDLSTAPPEGKIVRRGFTIFGAKGGSSRYRRLMQAYRDAQTESRPAEGGRT